MTLFISDIHRRSDSKYPFLEGLKDEALRYVLEKYSNNVDYAIDAGDTFNNRLFDAELALRQVSIYRECLHDISRFYCLLGNHDASGRAVSPMSIFAEGTKYAKADRNNKRGMTIIGKEPVQVGPYLLRGWDSNMEFPESNAQYLVSHARIDFDGFKADKSYSTEYLNSLRFLRQLYGDIHEPREVGKIVSIGTLCPSSFKDKDIEAGAILFDEDHNTFERIKIPNYPVFRLFTVTPETAEPDAVLVKGNIVRVEFKGPQKWITNGLRQKWQNTIWAMQPRYFEFGEEHFIGETKVEQQNAELSVEARYQQFATAKEWDESTVEIGTRALQ